MENENISQNLKRYGELADYVNSELDVMQKSETLGQVEIIRYRIIQMIGSFEDRLAEKKKSYSSLLDVLKNKVKKTRDSKLESL